MAAPIRGSLLARRPADPGLRVPIGLGGLPPAPGAGHHGAVSAVPAERVSLATRRRAFRLSEAARAALVRAPLVDDGGICPRTQIPGLDPVRVLLFGSGPLIGYGVERRRDAVDGQLAELLAERLGRGVVVESRVRLALPVEAAVDSLGGAGTVTFHTAIWAPRFSEELTYSSVGRSRQAVRTMLEAYRAMSDVPLIVCHLPTPLGNDWRTVLRRPRVARLNRVLDEEAAAVPGVTSTPTGNYWPAQGSAMLGPEWHRGLAEHLLPAAVDAVRRRLLVGDADPVRDPFEVGPGSPTGEVAMLEAGDVLERAADEMEQQGRPERAAQYLVLAWKARDCWRRHFAGRRSDPISS